MGGGARRHPCGARPAREAAHDPPQPGALPPRRGRATLRPRHAIVVFGCAVTAGGAPRPALLRRLRHALAEARRDPSALVIVSGGRVLGRPPEATAMRDWLVAEGVAAERVLVEAASRSTPENATFCAEVIAGTSVARVTLVTERYHMRRSHRLLGRALARRCPGVALDVSAAPDRLRGAGRALRGLGELVKLTRDLVWPPRQGRTSAA